MAQIIKADIDDIVFEDREQRYGGYVLRKKYPRRLMTALAIIMAAFALGVAAPAIIQAVANATIAGPTKVDVQLMDMPPPPPPVEEETPPPPPPPPPPKPQIRTMSFKVPEPKPAEDIKEEEPIKEIEELKEAPNIGLVDKEGQDKGVFDGEIDGDGDVPDVIVEEKKEPDADAFIFVQEEPKAVNLADIKKLVGYPQIARDAGIQGEVVVRILVDEKGNYSKHKVIKQMHPILAKAVEDQVSKLKFTPAIQGGKPIKFWVNVPFRFTLMN